MSEFVGAMLTSFHKRLNLHHKDLIHIEGGLGSQILGAIVFWNLQEILGTDKAKCDLTYFSEEAQRNGLWPYQLERFNISISEFKKFERKGKKNLLKAKKDFLSNGELTSNYWEESRVKHGSKFPFNSNVIESYFRELIEIDFEEHFAAIHIRRGDYLKVASKIIQFDEYTTLIESINKLLPNQVVVISDSEVGHEDKIKIQSSLEDHKVMFLDSPGIDPFNVHCLLREASVLVTSNSTYSFSAGLLGRPGQVVFSPMQFHSGESSEKYNKTFQSAGSFFVWPKRG
jgi:hypothetical protein